MAGIAEAISRLHMNGKTLRLQKKHVLDPYFIPDPLLQF